MPTRPITEHAILDIINQIENNMDNKMYSCGIFIDLKKAFDRVDHLILLQKLDHYGVCGVTLTSSVPTACSRLTL